MAYYRHSYMPGFTTNDIYGNFYDAKKASLITVPDRLKNYDLDVKNTRTSTSGAQYGDFLSQQQLQEQQQQPLWPLKPYGGAYSQREPLEGLDRHARPPPPPPMPPGQGALPPPPPLPPLQDPEPLASSREPPPPVSIERYRNPAAGRERPEETEAAAGRRLVRSRSPPPPPDLGTYRTNMEVYTGRSKAVHAPNQAPRPPPSPPSPGRSPPPSPSLPQPPPAMARGQGGQLPPALRFGAKEIHLPDIEAVELHMRDKSRVILNVREFYNRYLRD